MYPLKTQKKLTINTFTIISLKYISTYIITYIFEYELLSVIRIFSFRKPVKTAE